MGFSLKKGLVGGALLGPMGLVAGANGKTRNRGGDQGGLAGRYGDSYGNLLQGIQGGKTTEDILASILRDFRGSTEDMKGFFELAKPFLGAAEAGRLRGSDAFKHLSDQSNWDQGAMGGYGSAAGMLGQQANRALQGGAGRLAASGLGRGSARAALQQQGMQALGGQQADLWSRTFQQAQQNRWNSALGLLDANRALSQMALGQQVTPRMPTEGGPGALEMGAGLASGASGVMMGLGAMSL